MQILKKSGPWSQKIGDLLLFDTPFDSQASIQTPNLRPIAARALTYHYSIHG